MSSTPAPQPIDGMARTGRLTKPKEIKTNSKVDAKRGVSLLDQDPNQRGASSWIIRRLHIICALHHATLGSYG